MPRGMDERFEDPSEAEEDPDAETDGEDTGDSTSERGESTGDEPETNESPSSRTADQSESESGDTDTVEEDEPLNIREDWDSATIYVEPEQSEDIEVTFTRLKKQLKRENITLEKNKHFYRGIFEIAFEEHREETIERIGELARQDTET